MDTEESEGRLGELFLRLTHRARALQIERFAPLGLTPAQARALSVIGRCDRPPRMAELAEKLHVVPRAVTPLVDALEEAGLVHRRIDPENRRSTLLTLTERGLRLRRKVYETRTAAVEELFTPLTPDQRATLLELLETVDEAG
ncbi:MarR family winged helix-turn-helix transcriptional regulator [Qaidamihabitans albus]|uniref:MarR family winged helix-turn-helix transcriptional regulator n=1 Tax=Qaidamihabitans albus TaxID=2795733 RepID=UPI0018F11BAE|nr:MarR family transcriptional regulator [Qaidamihabitans albus]